MTSYFSTKADQIERILIDVRINIDIEKGRF